MTGPVIPTQRGGAARWKRLAVGGWEHREAARAARGAAPTSRQPGGFSGLREGGHESLLTTQWGLVRTVVDSDGLPAKDRTSLAPLTP